MAGGAWPAGDASLLLACVESVLSDLGARSAFSDVLLTSAFVLDFTVKAPLAKSPLCA